MGTTLLIIHSNTNNSNEIFFKIEYTPVQMYPEFVEQRTIMCKWIELSFQVQSCHLIQQLTTILQPFSKSTWVS